MLAKKNLRWLRRIEEFLSMEPSPAWRDNLARAEQFRQRVPSGGAPVLERSEVTYLVHSRTAIYIGYNTNLENIDPSLASDGSGGVNRNPSGRLVNDGRNFFVKVSYLFRF